MVQRKYPQVVIIGRPNVGKSTLFNRLVGKRVALVDDQPGVTRDRRFGIAGLLGLEFEAVDTAGWEDEDPSSLPGRMRAQTEVSVKGADAALFVFDARAGITPLDTEIARWLRGQNVPIVLLANKAEGRAGDAGINEAYSLGMGEPIGVSAEHGEGMAEIYGALIPILHDKAERLDIEAEAVAAIAADQAAARARRAQERAERAELRAIALEGGDEEWEDIEEEEDEEELDPKAPLSLAIVGRPNAGKSTLINRLLNEDRLLTGPEAGITRDSIAIDWIWNDPKSGEAREVKLVDAQSIGLPQPQAGRHDQPKHQGERRVDINGPFPIWPLDSGQRRKDAFFLTGLQTPVADLITLGQFVGFGKFLCLPLAVQAVAAW